MSISEQAKTQLIQLIAEGECLNAHDLEGFYDWVEASYEALEFDPVQQTRFDEYCRSSCGYASMRLFVGVWMLKEALYEEAPEEYSPTYSQV